MQNAGKPSIGFILSLIGGILIFVSSAIFDRLVCFWLFAFRLR
jgi:hypothetical protein